jgi:hypothetical protein
VTAIRLSRSGAAISLSISSSIAGSLMPTVFAAARGAGCLGAPEVALLVARRQRLAEAVGDQVEVELVLAALELRGVDGAHVHVDADALEVLLVGQRDALEARVVQQHLEGELLAVLRGHLAVLDLPSGLLEQRQRPPLQVAHVACAVRHRQLEFLGEDLVGDLAVSGSRYFSSAGEGRPEEASSDLPKNDVLRR